MSKLLVALGGPGQRVFSPKAARGVGYTCAGCMSRTTPAAAAAAAAAYRWQNQAYFSTSIGLHKKGASNKKSKAKSSSTQGVAEENSSKSTAADDPFDHSTLQAAIDQAISRLKDNLSRSRDAGRVSAAMIEGLAVEVNKQDRAKIGDIASVVPKGGRSMQVFCAEEAHVKAVMAALQASPYSLTPQIDATATGSTTGGGSPLVITVPVPPVTAETRQQAAAEAKRAAEKAGLEVRNARGDAQKRFRKMELERCVVVDELRKAHKGMEEVAKQGQEQVKTALDAALKALAR